MKSVVVRVKMWLQICVLTVWYCEILGALSVLDLWH
jgi:hypothetical protein